MASTLLSLTPLAADFTSPTASARPHFGVRNRHRFLGYEDGFDQEAFYTNIMPQGFVNDDLSVVIFFMMETVTTGDAVFEVAFERHDPTTDLDADSFATAKILVKTVPTTSGETGVATIAFAAGEYDGILASEKFRIRVRVLGTDSSHTVGDTVQVTGIALEQTAALGGGGGGGGFFNDGTGVNSAIGKGTTTPSTGASATNALAQGDAVSVLSAQGVAIGKSLSLGIGATDSVTFGQSNTVNKPRSLCWGSTNTVNPTGARVPLLTGGSGNTNNTNRGVAIGDNIDLPASQYGGANVFGLGNAIETGDYVYNCLLLGNIDVIGQFGNNSIAVGDNVGQTLASDGGALQALLCGLNVNAGDNYPQNVIAVGDGIDATPTGGSLQKAIVAGLDLTFNFSGYPENVFCLGELNTVSSQFNGFVHGQRGHAKRNNQRTFTANRDSALGDAQWSFIVERVQTTDATQTTILTFDLEQDKGYVIKAQIIGFDTTTNDQVAGFDLPLATAYRHTAGAAVLVNSPKSFTQEATAGAGATAADLAQSGNNVLARVTGLAGQTIEWVIVFMFTEVLG